MKRGFTLLEIILAVSVLALVGTMIYGGFSQTALNKARIEEDVDHSRIIHMALERMARELTMAFVSTHVNPSLDLRVVDTAFIGKDNGKDDRIDFTSFSHRRLYRNARESDQNEISYFVTEHPDEPGVQVLARREQIESTMTHGGVASHRSSWRTSKSSISNTSILSSPIGCKPGTPKICLRSPIGSPLRCESG